jgi:hypothetical protein
MVCIRPSTWKRLNQGGGIIVTVALVAMLLALEFGRFHNRNIVLALANSGIGFLLLFGVCIVATVIWGFFVKETITAGPNYLEKQYSLFGYNWSAVMAGPSVLRVETRDYGAWSRSGPQRQRAVRVENLGRMVTLYRETRSQSWIMMSLFSDNFGGFDTAYLLAHYLANYTKWQVIE